MAKKIQPVFVYHKYIIHIRPRNTFGNRSAERYYMGLITLEVRIIVI